VQAYVVLQPMSVIQHPTFGWFLIQGCAKTVFAYTTKYYAFAYLHTPVFVYNNVYRRVSIGRILVYFRQLSSPSRTRGIGR
jgi:hypothetical protein